VITFDQLSDGIQPIEGVISHLKVEGDRMGRSAGTTPSGDRRRRAWTLGGAVARSFMPSSKRAWVAVLICELATSK
jgi:hypothetical protein